MKRLVLAGTLLSLTMLAPLKGHAQTLTCKYISTVRCVDSVNTAGWSGTDVHGWINSAYADLPTPSGTNKPAGKILVFPKPDGSCYSVSTQLLLNTDGKPAVIDFQGSCIDASGMTSTTAQVYDWGQGEGIGGRVSNLHLIGPCSTTACSGVTAKGMVWGPSNGLVGATFENVYIGTIGSAGGFLEGIDASSAAVFMEHCISCYVYRNNIGVHLGVGAEGTKFTGGSISQNATGVQTAGSGSKVEFMGVQFDDNTTVSYDRTSTTTFNVDFISCHFENSGLGSLQVMNDGSAGGVTKFIGGDIHEDRTSGTNSQFMSMGGDMLLVDGMAAFSAGITVTEAVHITAGSSYLKFILLGSHIASVTNNTGNRYVDDSLRDDTIVPILQRNFYATSFIEHSSAPNSQSSQDMCYGDSSAHAMKCSYNNGSFLPMPQGSSGTQTSGQLACIKSTSPVVIGTCTSASGAACSVCN